jgi:type II restriction/modification system DNA methylase subunit YeeA
MDTSILKKFAQNARRQLLEQVSAKLELVLDINSTARRESPKVVVQLEKQVSELGLNQLIDKVAYTWFNRFCALRFIDVNGYTGMRVTSPAEEGQTQPEILAEAKAGYIDVDRTSEHVRIKIQALLNGSAPSHDPQQEAYRLLVVAECNSFHKAMPYLFERITDYTELLMPDDLLSGNSILAHAREALTPDACQNVEVIGWLYQFYISEKKDQVFDGLKKNQKITSENIPAATQLFTPHWIVRYLVENSLGRLWLLNHPNSSLGAQMDYYIAPETPESDFLRISRPEDIKICDPACGSGHILSYAFDLLYAIYEEVGTDQSEIPEKILTHNLFGIEIDERAGELAAFALTMKARARSRRFFKKGIKPNICVLQKVNFASDELDDYFSEVGRDLLTLELRETLLQFTEADNLGSLITPKLTSVVNVLPVLEAKDIAGNLFLANTHTKVLKVLRMVDYLNPRYEVVVANPPYMGSKGMNENLSDWAKRNYPNSKSDLFAMFIERSIDLTLMNGAVAMIAMQSWMFLSSFESLRIDILNRSTILSLVHLGARAFDSIGGSIVSTAAFVIHKYRNQEFPGSYLRLTQGNSENEKTDLFHAAKSSPNNNSFRASALEFMRIPGNPIAYWASHAIYQAFENGISLGEIAAPRQGLATGCNELFLRRWHEVPRDSIGLSIPSREEAQKTEIRWYPYNKGGNWRKWFGNCDFVVDWLNDGFEIRNFKDENGKVRSRPQNTEYYFKEGVTWGDITTTSFAARYTPPGFLFDVKGSSGFPSSKDLKPIIGLLNSKLMRGFMLMLNPTSTFQVGDIARVPYIQLDKFGEKVDRNVDRLVAIARADWESYENSWNYNRHSLMRENVHDTSLIVAYQKLRAHWHEMTLETQRLENENNTIFINAYRLNDEMHAEVPISDISLTCNPHYRYTSQKQECDLESLLLADTMKELISYAVGCMFGRYSLVKPEMSQSELGSSFSKIPYRSPQNQSQPDESVILPFAEGQWFADDVTERFREFLRAAYGENYFEENLQYIEKAIGKDISKYFIKDFYTDHVKRYRKRPIYWMFSSPKGTFNVLIYLHRYRPDTVNIVLRYLREFRTKLAAQKDYLQQVVVSASASQADKARANRKIDTLKKQLLEVDDYERDTLYPLATQQVVLDLDDGVKMNYLKLGRALKKIVGLNAKDEN